MFNAALPNPAMLIRELDVIKNGKEGEPFIVVRINDCRASCIGLRGRSWNDPETVVKESEPTFGISANTEIDNIFTRRLGTFAGTVEARKLMTFDRSMKELKVIYMPMPGNNPRKKRRPVMASIVDDDSPLDMLKVAADKITTIVNIDNV